VEPRSPKAGESQHGQMYLYIGPDRGRCPPPLPPPTRRKSRSGGFMHHSQVVLIERTALCASPLGGRDGNLLARIQIQSFRMSGALDGIPEPCQP
jgi:hypothetical protein